MHCMTELLSGLADIITVLAIILQLLVRLKKTRVLCAERKINDSGTGKTSIQNY